MHRWRLLIVLGSLPRQEDGAWESYPPSSLLQRLGFNTCLLHGLMADPAPGFLYRSPSMVWERNFTPPSFSADKLLGQAVILYW